MSSQVEAYLYDFEYIVDYPHNTRNKIREIFIPSLGICFNCTDIQFNVFRNKKPRNKISQSKTTFTESILELAKTDPNIAALIEEDKRKQIPEEPTPITKIYLDQSFVNELLLILQHNDYKDKVQSIADRYLGRN